MSTANSQIHDYSTGELRRHHEFYIEEADIYLQVEKAVFKVHRYFLAHRSSVLREMFQTPQSTGSKDGTEAKPLILIGDSAAGWEALFKSIYSASILKSAENLDGDALIGILRLAHKYCMETVEEEILSHFKGSKNREGFVKLFIASQIVGSVALHDQAITGLIAYKTSITLEEARQLGLEAIHAIMVTSGSLYTTPSGSGGYRYRGHGIPTYRFDV